MDLRPVAVVRLLVPALFLIPVSAQAGMAMPRFTDVAAARLDVISFFIVGYFLCAFLYQRLWNSLRKDFRMLPELSYQGALAGLIVCGLFIYVVLTMISGARELMTPGAWARSGVIYKLRDPEQEPKPWLDSARRESLERLRAGLWKYAQKNGGGFPPSREDPSLPSSLWRSIDPDGLHFIYFPGLRPDHGREVVAYEPASFGRNRYALLSSGEVVGMTLDELKERVREQIRVLDATATKKVSS